MLINWNYLFRFLNHYFQIKWLTIKAMIDIKTNITDNFSPLSFPIYYRR